MGVPPDQSHDGHPNGEGLHGRGPYGGRDSKRADGEDDDASHGDGAPYGTTDDVGAADGATAGDSARAGQSGAIPVPDGLASMPPGPRLAAVLAQVPVARVRGRDVPEVMAATYRQANHDRAAFLRTVLESGLRKPGSAETVARLELPGEFAAEHVRAHLVWSRRRADTTFALAWDIHVRLPMLGEAMYAGDLDEPRAVAFAQWTDGLTEDQAAQICAHLLPVGPGMLVGQLIEAIKRAAIAIDPDWAERRYKKALKGRRVVGTRNEDGTATITGHDLPVDRAAAACDRIDTLAMCCKRAGDKRPVNHIRVDLFLGMLDGTYEHLADHDVIAHVLAHPFTTSGDENGSQDDGPGGGRNNDDDDGRGGDLGTGGDLSGGHSGGQGGVPGSDDDGGGDDSGGQGGGRGGAPGSDDGMGGGSTNDNDDDGDLGDGGAGGGAPGGDDDGGLGDGGAGGGPPGGDDDGGQGGGWSSGPDGLTADDGVADSGGADKPGDAGHTSADDRPILRGAQADSHSAFHQRKPSAGYAGAGWSVRELRAEMSSLLGLDERPGEIVGWGFVPAAVVRDVILTMRPAEWRWVVCDHDGHPIDCGITTRRPALPAQSAPPGQSASPGQSAPSHQSALRNQAAPSNQAAPPHQPARSRQPMRPDETARLFHRDPTVRGGIVELQLRATDLDRLARTAAGGPWAAVVADIAAQFHANRVCADPVDRTVVSHGGQTYNGDDAAGISGREGRPDANGFANDATGVDALRRVAGVRLRRAVQTRDRNCTHPACRMPGTRTDQDHAINHAHGGLTVAANLSCCCRHDHRLKHEGGWLVHKPNAVTTVWVSPLGHHYVNRPPPVIHALPRPRPRPVDETAVNAGIDTDLWRRLHGGALPRNLPCGCFAACGCVPIMPPPRARQTGPRARQTGPRATRIGPRSGGYQHPPPPSSGLAYETPPF